MAYWALKTRESRENRQDMSEDHWDDFVREKVIAIGWEKLDISPDNASPSMLINSLKSNYGYSSDKQASIVARIIQKFVNISIGDRVLICQGYSPNQLKDVRLYGVAIVTSPFKNNLRSSWWDYQHDAKIEPFANRGNKKIPKALFEKKLNKGSLLLTIHEISKEGFESVVEWARH
ncbi:MAG: hypothetical protein KAW90_02545 [Dehalococcoidales bacterium]|nr:hypothetical protein [Dehalococcoidales bacterium]